MTTAMQYSQYDGLCDGAICTQKMSPRMFTTPKPGMKEQRTFKKREPAETSGGDNTAVDLAILT